MKNLILEKLKRQLNRAANKDLKQLMTFFPLPNGL